MTSPIRLLDLGEVSPLRSQAVYHGLAEASAPDSPDTIVLLRPASPYFCVGFHQNPAQELDLPWCRQHGYPVLHRKIGGGTVYLDRNQLFYQCIVHRSRAPLRVNTIYEKFLAAPAAALRALGLRATLEEPNEIEVGGKRIAGTGGGQIGEAMVVTGNILFDFNYNVMARAWRAPSKPFRRLAREGLRRYLTTLRRELRDCPRAETLTEMIARAYAETLGAPLLPGSLTAPELRAIEAVEAELASDAFVLDGGGRREPGLKIARGVYVFEGRAKRADVRISLRVRQGVIDALAVRGSSPRAGQRLVGRRIAALESGAEGKNPADIVGELLAAGGPSEWVT